MRFGLKKSPIAVAIMAVVVLALVAMAATATAVSAQSVAGGPSIPSIKPDDLARFKVTVSGRQASGTDFTRIPEADGCTLQIEGSLGEEWLYERDPGVTMEFQKFGHTILLQRAHRAIGDAAFATKGSILRTASGFLNVKNGLSCISYPLPDPICGKFVKAPLDIALTWSGGKLGIRSSSKADQQTNPAEKCGQSPPADPPSTSSVSSTPIWRIKPPH
jgi:hypothetical protein